MLDDERTKIFDKNKLLLFIVACSCPFGDSCLQIITSAFIYLGLLEPNLLS